MTADLDKLEAIARAATQGVWEHDSACESVYAASGYRIADIPVVCPLNATRQKANAEHIVAFSPERVLALLAVVRAASKVSAMSEDGGDSLVGEAFSLWFAQWQSAWATLRSALAALDALEEKRHG